IALFGHSGSHAPQFIHSSVILIAIKTLFLQANIQLFYRSLKLRGFRHIQTEIILTNFTIEERIDAFARLGHFLRDDGPAVKAVKAEAVRQNSWFTEANVSRAVTALGSLLTFEQLEKWLAPYPFDAITDQTVGLVCAGNVPMVGFHDQLAILLSGFRLQVKFSSDDQVLNRFALEHLIELEPRFVDRVTEVDRLRDFDLVIATGSNNTARYFNHYFAKYPHIIRRNRNGLGILDGNETVAQLQALGDDIFSYFGLGCRNVSKLYLPENYDIAVFFEGIAEHHSVMDHHKYRNNYDFNKSIYLINGDKHYDNGFLLLKPDSRLGSPLAVLHYETYSSFESLVETLNADRNEIQCIVSNAHFSEN